MIPTKEVMKNGWDGRFPMEFYEKLAGI